MKILHLDLITLLVVVILFVATDAPAALNCYTDSLGYTSCTGTDGYRSDSYKDDLGYTDGRDNQGNTWSCYTDSLGYTHCQ